MDQAVARAEEWHRHDLRLVLPAGHVRVEVLEADDQAALLLAQDQQFVERRRTVYREAAVHADHDALLRRGPDFLEPSAEPVTRPMTGEERDVGDGRRRRHLARGEAERVLGDGNRLLGKGREGQQGEGEAEEEAPQHAAKGIARPVGLPVRNNGGGPVGPASRPISG